MSYLFKNYLRANIEFIKANGNELIDQTGRSYIDFSSGIGVTNLGFNEDVKEAVEQQYNSFGIRQIFTKVYKKKLLKN